LFKLYCLYSKEKQVDHFIYIRVIKTKHFTIEERNYIFKAQVSASIYLFYFKKIYKKIYLKEYYLAEQGLYKLEANKKKVSN